MVQFARLAVRWIVVLLSIAIIIVGGLYFLNRDAALDFLSRNIYLYSGIMIIGGVGFAIVAIRILVWKANNWDSMLEGVGLAGIVAALIIFQEGNIVWKVPGWCALLTAFGCFFLRFLDPRRGK